MNEARSDDDARDQCRLFICHRHADERIATVLRQFVEKWTAGKVDVFQSSHEGSGPKIGEPLPDQIQNALRNSEMIFVVHTVSDEHSDYVMFEAGYAFNPRQEDTRIVVFKCGKQAPAPLSELVFVEVQNETSVRTFVTQFLTDETCFPRRGKAITNHAAESDSVKDAGDELVAQLKEIASTSADEYWPTSPYIVFELTLDQVKEVSAAVHSQDIETAHAAVRTHAIIRDSDKFAPAMFGIMSFEEELGADTLFSRWEQKFPERSPLWIQSLLEQMASAAAWAFPRSGLSIFSSESEYWHIPLLVGVYKKPSKQCMHLEVHFPRVTRDAVDIESEKVRVAIG